MDFLQQEMHRGVLPRGQWVESWLPGHYQCDRRISPNAEQLVVGVVLRVPAKVEEFLALTGPRSWDLQQLEVDGSKGYMAMEMWVLLNVVLLLQGFQLQKPSRLRTL